MPSEVCFTEDAAEAGDAVVPFLHDDPVRHNVVCTLIDERARTGAAVRCWWVRDAGAVRGVAFQSPETFPVLVSGLDADAVDPLAAAVAAVSDPAVPGVNGTSHDAARFAGAFATVSRRPAAPVEGLRVYEVTDLVVPGTVAGAPRQATPTEIDLAVRWTHEFAAETASLVDPDPVGRARRLVDSGRLWLWMAAGEPRSTAIVSAPAAGVVRVGFVYTPPEHRNNGFAAALVAHLSRLSLGAGKRCILYTQLANPVSNALYQRLGYRPVHECVRYEFG